MFAPVACAILGLLITWCKHQKKYHLNQVSNLQWLNMSRTVRFYDCVEIIWGSSSLLSAISALGPGLFYWLDLCVQYSYW